MARNLGRYILAGLAGAGNVSAAPWAQVASVATTDAAVSTVAPTPVIPSISAPAPAAPVDSAAAASAAAANAALAKEVQAGVTNVNRFNTLLTVDGAGKELLAADELAKRVVFDFGAKAATLGSGGRFVLANENSFPILVDQGLSTAVAFLNPCGMNSPHIHPRATEWLTVVQGQLQTGFMLENGFLADPDRKALTTEISATLSAFQGTVFPQGSIHFQFNPTCEPATFIATLNSADPGTSQVAQNLFFIDDAILNITLGNPSSIDGSNIDDFRATLPGNLVQAVDSCLARCNAAGAAPTETATAPASYESTTAPPAYEATPAPASYDAAAEPPTYDAAPEETQEPEDY